MAKEYLAQNGAWLWKQKMGIVNLHLTRFYFPVDLPKREAYGYHFDQ